MVIARKHLAPDPWRDSRSDPRRLCVLERPDQLGIATRTLDDLGADLDLAPRAVLPAAMA